MHYTIIFFTVVFGLILAITSPEIVFGYAGDDVEILVYVDKSSYKVGDLLNIKGTGAHSYTVFANIISPNGDLIVELMFIAAKSGDFSTVWIIPRGLDDGTYIIQIKDVKKQAQTTFDIGNITKLQNSSENESAQKIPDWVKNNAGWWADDIIADKEFVLVIRFLMTEGFLSTNDIPGGFPDQLRKQAKNWSTEQISDKEFLRILENFLDNPNLEPSSESEQQTQIDPTSLELDAEPSDESSQKIPEWVRNIFVWYAENQVSEDELLNAIKYLINEEIIKLD